MQAQYKILCTFNDFELYWTVASQKNVRQKLQLWQSIYMSKYPELLKKQIKSYEEEGLNWQKIAMEKVFPTLDKHFPFMQKAQKNLLLICGSTYKLSVQTLKVDFPIIFVLYVGIGVGAGWATQYKSQHACLLGLEKIAELGWYSRKRLKSLLAHEIGHLVHMQWRGEFEKFKIFEKVKKKARRYLCHLATDFT